jgi:hypothetical protein
MNFEVISDCQEKHLKTFLRELQIVQHLETMIKNKGMPIAAF